MTTKPTTYTGLIVQARKGPKCSEASLKDFESLWNELVLLLGIKVSDAPTDKAIHSATLKALSAYMTAEYPALSLDEIRLAYRLGCKGDLGIDMFAELNARQVGKVLDAYRKFRAGFICEPLPKPSGLLSEKTPEPTAEEFDRQMRILFALAYEKVKGGGSYQDYGNLVYDWLKSKGRANFSKEVRQQILQAAETAVRREFEIKGKGFAVENRKARQIAQILADEGVGSLPSDVQHEVWRRAKQLGLDRILRDMIELDITLDDFWLER